MSDDKLTRAAEKYATKICSRCEAGVPIEEIPVVDPDMFESFIAGAKYREENPRDDLRAENLSALLIRCFYWARNREPRLACEKISELSEKCHHLLTPINVLRQEDELATDRRFLLESIRRMDGAAVMNLQEPSEGDLERINDAYIRERAKTQKLVGALRKIGDVHFSQGILMCQKIAYQALKEWEGGR